MMGFALRTLAILVGSAVLGAGYVSTFKPELEWIPSDQQIELENEVRDDLKVVQERREEIRSRTTIDADRLMALVEAGAFVIDNRTPAEFEQGHLAAPFIVNATPEDMVLYGQMLDQLLLLQPPVPIVLYCRSVECDDSKTSFATLERLFAGMSDLSSVFIFTEGWAGIQSLGLPTVAGPAQPFELVLTDAVIAQQTGDLGVTGGEFEISDPNMIADDVQAEQVF